MFQYFLKNFKIYGRFIQYLYNVINEKNDKIFNLFQYNLIITHSHMNFHQENHQINDTQLE